MNPLDNAAHSSPFKSWSPIGKLLMVVGLLCINLIGSSLVVPLLSLTIGALLLLVSCRWSLPRGIAMLILSGILFISITAALVALVEPGAPILSFELLGIDLTITVEGVNRGVLVWTRAVAGLVLMMFFASSTPMNHLFVGLRRMGLPKEIADLSVLIYKNLFVLIDIMGKMHIAAESRLGFNGYRRSLGTTSRIATGVFVQSLSMAERAQIGLSCRNYQGGLTVLDEPSSLSATWILTIAAVMLIMGLTSIASDGWLMITV